MKTHWLRFLRGPGRPETVRQRSAPALETLEDRWVPSGTVVATSYFDSAVYEFNSHTGALIKTVVAPYSQSTLNGPAGTAVGPDGNLYFSSQNNNSIVEYNIKTGALTTFITSSVLNPIATANGDASFAPAGPQFGPDNNLYVSLNGGQNASSGGAVVRFGISRSHGVLTPNGNNITIATGLIQPTEMTFGKGADDNSLYVSNAGTGSVVKIAHALGKSPTTTTFISAGSGGLQFPAGLSWHGGNLFVVDLGATSPYQGQVLEYHANGSFDKVFAQSNLQGAFPSAAVFTPDGHLLTADLGPNYPPNLQGSIDDFNPNGTFDKTLVSSSAFPNTGQGTSGFSPSQMTLYVIPNLPPHQSSGQGSTDHG